MFPHRGFGSRKPIPEAALKHENIRRESGVRMHDFRERGLLILHVAVGLGEIPDIGFPKTVKKRAERIRAAVFIGKRSFELSASSILNGFSNQGNGYEYGTCQYSD